jgi:acyl-CoA synthetase (AMP-forming)/AMP-acid ligase II
MYPNLVSVVLKNFPGYGTESGHRGEDKVEDKVEEMAMQTLGDITRHHARLHGDKLALTYVENSLEDSHRSWTFAGLEREANRIANALLAEGVKPGERIAYLDKYFLYLLGGAKVNAVSVAVNWRLAVPEMEYILNNSEARVLLVGEEYLAAVAAMNLPGVARIIVLGEPGKRDHPTFDQWLADRSDVDPRIPVAAEDVCYQLYTSGTTGLPKGVEITHANFVHAMRESMATQGFHADAVNLVCMPLFHISGSGWGLIGMYYGAASVMLRDVDLELILGVIPEFRVTHALFVPAVLQFLLAHPLCRSTDFGSLENITYGASPITEAVLVEGMTVFGCDFIQAYGLTETTGAVAALAPEDHDPEGPRSHLLRSCGRAIANHEIAIFDPDTGEPVADGAVGEIWVRGPQIMKGYWQNAAATAEAIRSDGWFRSGDAGYLEDGYLYIHDRVKDMIISGGENVYPAEIENVLMQHDSVTDAAVIGVPSERWGETVKAIVTRADESLTEQAVMEHCRRHLAGFKCPTSVDWMDQIPRNPSGKILKVELRKPYWAGKDRQVS